MDLCVCRVYIRQSRLCKRRFYHYEYKNSSKKGVKMDYKIEKELEIYNIMGSGDKEEFYECKNCGSNNAEGASFCSNCGEVLHSSD